MIFKKLMTLGLSAVLAVGMASQSFCSDQTEAEAAHDIVILVTSDVHCGIDQGFGYAGLEQIRETMEADGDLTLLVDDGDSIQGEVIGTITDGEAIIDMMNEMHYDVAIPGNHEFDYGMDQFLHLTDEADFPYISCNFNKEGELVFDPYVIKEIGGKKIGFVGVTTPRTIVSSTPASFQDDDGNYIYGFMQDDDTGKAVYEAVQSAVDGARKDGADYVFVMAHLGNEAECEPWTYADVISHISGIDGFLDGHSHDTDQVTMKDKKGNEVFRMAVGTKLNGLGCVRISAEDGSLSHDFLSWQNDDSLPELTGIDNRISDYLDQVMEKYTEKLEAVIAKADFDLLINDPEAVDDNGAPIRIVRRAETNLGDLCADAYRDAVHADIGIANGGGVRADVLAGDITYADIIRVNPFNNTLCVIEATGQQILDALEWGAHMVPEENGGFLQVSGLTYEIHTDIESGCIQDENGMFQGIDGDYRVKNVMVGTEPLDLKKTYTVAGCDYIILQNGDGYTMFDGCSIVQQGGCLDNQALIDYLSGPLGGVVPDEYADPYGDGRVTAVE